MSKCPAPSTQVSRHCSKVLVIEGAQRQCGEVESELLGFEWPGHGGNLKWGMLLDMGSCQPRQGSWMRANSARLRSVSCPWGRLPLAVNSGPPQRAACLKSPVMPAFPGQGLLTLPSALCSSANEFSPRISAVFSRRHPAVPPPAGLKCREGGWEPQLPFGGRLTFHQEIGLGLSVTSEAVGETRG